MMKDRGVKKEPGRSWIEANNSVHAFFAGDQKHPCVDKIYEYLRDLNERAAKNGYIPQTNSLLNDVEQRQKGPTQIIHSEKLAIAFGLLSLSSSTPIHVFKNLRVCGDCHSWIKYVSKISGRMIIVRDSYRFHHFKGDWYQEGEASGNLVTACAKCNSGRSQTVEEAKVRLIKVSKFWSS
ncbi:Pentatricopeptide repeat-containing protein [Spatholobus suberectus]|nr:Pentatricopeptide repeat-containing protein [Spatholobus suberectus]